jgi:parallel beta-helix repeat protein
MNYEVRYGRRAAQVCALAGLLMGCDGNQTDPVDSGPADAVTCSQAGTMHEGTFNHQIWLAKDNPHHFRGLLRVTGVLTLEPGVLVCGDPAARLLITVGLLAVGTPEKPIVITATDPAQHGIGITVGNAEIAYATFEHGEYGINVDGSGSLVVDRSRFRQLTNHAIAASSDRTTSEIRRSVFDSVGGVLIAAGVFEDNVIHGGSGLTISASRVGTTDLLGGRIEGTSAAAISMPVLSSIGTTARFGSVRPLRIVGGGGPIVSMPVNAFLQLWPTRAHQDSLLGNLNDTLALFANGSTALPLPASPGKLVLRPEFSWRFAQMSCGQDCDLVVVDTLDIEAGAGIELRRAQLSVGRRLAASGTGSQPIRFAGDTTACPLTPVTGTPSCGIRLRGTSATPSVMSNAILTNVFLFAEENHAVTLSRIQSNERVMLSVAGSSIADSDLHDFRRVATASSVALTLSGAAVRAVRTAVRRSGAVGIMINASDVVLESCDVLDNVGDGIRVTNGSNIRARNCNVERNGGMAMNNSGPDPVDARSNWWGDASGPSGGSVSSRVDATSWLIERRAALALARRST